MVKLESLLARLTQQGVKYVVVGGYAAMSHGVTLLTQDIDLCIPFTTANLLKLQSAIEDLHPVHRMTPQKLPLALTRSNCRGLKNLYLYTDWGPLDCLSAVLGVGGFDQALASSVKLDLPFGSCRVLDLDALIKAKECLDRPRDREAARQLRMLRERLRTAPKNSPRKARKAH